MELKVRVEATAPLAVSVTLAGFKEAMPVGETATESVTVPAKLLMLVTVMVEEAVAPALRTNALGFALRLKVGSAPTTMVIVTVCDNVPLTPVTVTEYCP